MKENLFTEICKIDNLKIRTKNLINQLSKDEVLYLHLHLAMDTESEEGFNDLTFPLSLNDFETAKKRINHKKLKRDILADDVITILETESGIENSKWFKMNIFKDTDSVVKSSNFYTIFYNLITRVVLEDFKGLSAGSFIDYISKLSTVGKGKKPEYDCVKSVCALHLSEELFDMKNNLDASDKSEEAQGKLKKAIIALQKAMVVGIHNNYTLVCKETIEEMDRNMKTLKSDVKKGNLLLEDKNSKIRELKEDLKNVTKQLKVFQKIEGLACLETNVKIMEERLRKIEETSLDMSQELKNVKGDIVNAAYQNQIDNYIIKVTDLKKELSMKSSECKELKKTVEIMDRNIEDRFIEHVKKNGLSSKMNEFIKSLIDEDDNLMQAYLDGEFSISEEVERDSEMVVGERVPKITRKIGYVTIEEGTHYVTLQNGKKEKVFELSEKMYLADNQFVIVDENYSIVKTTISKYEDNSISIKNLKLGTVENLNPLRVKVEGQYIDVAHNPNYTGKYNLDQVVGLNECNQIVRAFKRFKFNADSVINSIKAREIKVYYVLNIYNEFLSLRDIETGKEDIHKLDTGDMEIVKLAVLFVKGEKVISALARGKFYTSSSFYANNISHGPIERIGDEFKLTKANGESVFVRNIPEGYILEDGQVVAIDEFNNYLYISPTDKTYIEKSVSRKTAKQVITPAEFNKPIETKGEVTIVGNPYYKNAYIMAFFKQGYKVNVLHGYDTGIDKIVQVAKDSEAIIVNKSYCSHDNFGQIKAEVKKGRLFGKKYICTQEDGANMLLYRFNELLVEKEIAVTN